MHMHRAQKLKATNGDVAFKFVLVMMLQLTVAIMDPLWRLWNEYKGLAGFHVIRQLLDFLGPLVPLSRRTGPKWLAALFAARKLPCRPTSLLFVPISLKEEILHLSLAYTPASSSFTERGPFFFFNQYNMLISTGYEPGKATIQLSIPLIMISTITRGLIASFHCDKDTHHTLPEILTE
ncbi:Uncharacterized protein HZ326_30879 [Fusarium oxysporum f. sp. albedinis]|nr:Uncharacterized protein HZ326_30879 [Fusarium oxysporum f. sp. albedinis]